MEVNCIHGKLNQTFHGLASSFSRWDDFKWQEKILLRPVNIAPNQTFIIKHESSGGHLFAFKAEEPTGTPASGGEIGHGIETILSARIAYWEPVMASFPMKPDDGPKDTFEAFIQRD